MNDNTNLFTDTDEAMKTFLGFLMADGAESTQSATAATGMVRAVGSRLGSSAESLLELSEGLEVLSAFLCHQAHQSFDRVHAPERPAHGHTPPHYIYNYGSKVWRAPPWEEWLVKGLP